MIRSMTAFIRNEIKNTHQGVTIWELRSVNHRYLDICIRLPEKFRSLELIVRERIQACISRGKIQCDLYLNSTPNTNRIPMVLNKTLAKNLINAAEWIKKQSGEGEIDPMIILQWPGIMVDEEEFSHNMCIEELLITLDLSLRDFIHVRETEGIALKEIIEQQLTNVSTEVSKIRVQIPEIITWKKEKLFHQLKDTQIQLDPYRVEQEIVMLIQKLDITEELDRLETHIKETFNILKNPKKEAIGRRLNFMMQELHRESNTLSTKSINTNITASAIDIKVLIEQMREQIQNIE